MNVPRPTRQASSLGFALWLLWHNLIRTPLRFGLEAVAVAFPVAMLAATLWYVDGAVQTMTPNALAHIQVEMRGVAKSLDSDIAAISAKLSTAPNVIAAEPFAAAKVVISNGNSGQLTARLFAVGPGYLASHPWVKTLGGALSLGAMLSQSVSDAPEFAGATSVTIGLPGDAPEFSLTLPIGGAVDLRDATTWFSIPYGDVQGDIVTVPRAIVIDYATFEAKVLPTLRDWAKLGGLPAFDPGANELPPADLESHITIDHGAYPADPGLASLWTGRLQKALSLQAGSTLVIADNAAEALLESHDDAINAKMLFLLLGIPGFLVAAGLGLTAAAALAESYRRDEALLRMRGASEGQLSLLVVTQTALSGLTGAAFGLLVALVAVTAATGRAAWQGVPPSSFLLSAGVAVAAGAITGAVRVIALLRARGRDISAERRLLGLGWNPPWRWARLDLVFIAVGLTIFGINILAGGLKRSPVEGTALMLSFYVLLAPLALWIGGTLMATRLTLLVLAAWARVDRPLTSWPDAALRWLGRRPAHAGRALITGTLAVAFGVQVLTFTATYNSAKSDDARAAIGSDLRITPGNPRLPLPPLGPDVQAFSPIRLVPARIDTDRKTIMAIDPQSFAATTTSAPRMVDGTGLAALLAQPGGVLINKEIASDFELAIGDDLEVTIFPDDFESAKDMKLKVLGIYNAFPPTFPETEAITTVGALPRAELAAPDYYMARAQPGLDAVTVAAHLTEGPLAAAPE